MLSNDHRAAFGCAMGDSGGCHRIEQQFGQVNQPYWLAAQVKNAIEPARAEWQGRDGWRIGEDFAQMRCRNAPMQFVEREGEKGRASGRRRHLLLIEHLHGAPFFFTQGSFSTGWQEWKERRPRQGGFSCPVGWLVIAGAAGEESSGCKRDARPSGVSRQMFADLSGNIARRFVLDTAHQHIGSLSAGAAPSFAWRREGASGAGSWYPSSGSPLTPGVRGSPAF